MTYYKVLIRFVDADGNIAAVQAVTPKEGRSGFGVADAARLQPCSAIVQNTSRHCLRLADGNAQPDELPRMISLCGPHLRAWREEKAALESYKNEMAQQDRCRQEYEDGRRALVYYLQRSDDLIKIGYSGNFRARFLALQREHGALRILATHRGGSRAEAAMHDRFHADRVMGEWFNPSEALLAHVAKVAGRERRRKSVA